MADTFDPVTMATLERIQNADPVKDPSMLERFKLWLQSLGGPQQQVASRGVADAANAMLPDALSGRSALMQAAERRRQLEAASLGR